MGQAKRDWEEYEARGWSAPDKHVCPNCVEDEFLKALIQSCVSQRKCDYCGRRTRDLSAAPVESIMPAVAAALNYFYAEPTHAGVPYDGGWVFEPTDTADALMGVPFDCHDDLFEDIANAFSNTAWISAADGHWASSHRNEEWSSAWQSFSEIVKHRSRHFFMSSTAESKSTMRPSPLDVLELVSGMAARLELLTSMPKATHLYRVRERVGTSDWPICAEQVGAPPSHLANAGRMNPAGISYLYLSMTRGGALAEVLRGPPCRAAIATFELVDTLAVLDLTRLPSLPSVFDEAKHRLREVVLFLDDFVEDICQPVQKDGQEHISYVPSQVVSEYFAQVFKTVEGKVLDGIVYPSAVAPGGVNLALFPRDGGDPFAHAVRFVDGDELALKDWTEFSKTISQ
ncbi:HEPN-associated N-terminal domain-containing protein [Kinneretia aquatilis]|uniref:HEPN-associated N-terminal domain-containing protein n=1 Tax=Kinneretia aquatilis TaxID=2070761 RepID=UPI001495313D|nr:HEPN-associated N-terminal domain-containing protein [Paucibacter aquatile]WIV99687.1 HEPN-associated N-terminal domain-containing protein [Paucibacter aquatile]